MSLINANQASPSNGIRKINKLIVLLPVINE